MSKVSCVAARKHHRCDFANGAAELLLISGFLSVPSGPTLAFSNTLCYFIAYMNTGIQNSIGSCKYCPPGNRSPIGQGGQLPRVA